MDNHPIPQDVTGFKFKLIGSITVKQFLYLLGAGIISTIVFVIPTQSLLAILAIKAPIIAVFALSGLALAFVPIDGRPLDTMIMNFLLAVPRENQYIYKKRGLQLSSFEFFKPTALPQSAPTPKVEKASQQKDDARKTMLASRMITTSYKPDAGESQFFSSVKSLFDELSIAAEEKARQLRDLEAKKQVFTPSPKKQTSPTKSDVEIAQKSQEEKLIENTAKNLEEMFQEVLKPQPQPPPKPPPPPPKVEPLKAAPAPVNPVVHLKAQKPEEVSSTTISVASTPHVRVIDQAHSMQAGFPTLPDVANVLLGIVKDPRGKVLPNILVEVIDTNDIPVRAFKTNALGQFAAATPLKNGTYTLHLEDSQKRNEFEEIKITLKGEIFLPLEIISNDEREKLRRELFEKSATSH